jgi:hypothetical protein
MAPVRGVKRDGSVAAALIDLERADQHGRIGREIGVAAQVLEQKVHQRAHTRRKVAPIGVVNGPLLARATGTPICNDPGGVDRAVLHQQVGDDVVAFFNQRLAPQSLRR